MKKIFFILVLFFFSFEYLFSSENGKELYEKAKCERCHGFVENFDVKKGIASNKHSLESWVSSCSKFFKIGWDAFEQEEVTEYLNSYYEFN